MPEASINYLAVLACGFLGFLLGGLWYSPLMFAKPWIAAMAKLGHTEASMKKVNPTKQFVGAFVLSILMAYVLSDVVDFSHAVTWVDGVKTGFWMWAGFVATSMIMNGLFEFKPAALLVIDSLYFLVALMAQGVILAIWQ